MLYANAGRGLPWLNTFFSVVREHYQQNLVHQKNAKVQQREANTQQAQQSLFNDILTIMTDILKEEASSSLVGVILQNLVKEGKDQDVEEVKKKKNRKAILYSFQLAFQTPLRQKISFTNSTKWTTPQFLML